MTIGESEAIFGGNGWPPVFLAACINSAFPFFALANRVPPHRQEFTDGTVCPIYDRKGSTTAVSLGPCAHSR